MAGETKADGRKRTKVASKHDSNQEIEKLRTQLACAKRDADAEIAELLAKLSCDRIEASEDIRQLRLQLSALKMERDFWVEQARTLQNHLQAVLRGQATILEQLARQSVSPDDVKDVIQQLSSELRKPLTTVDATVALCAAVREGTQGTYTPALSTECLK